MTALRLARGVHRPARRSSSSPAAITATSTRCSCAPAPARRRSACRTAPACRRQCTALTRIAEFNDVDEVSALLPRGRARDRRGDRRAGRRQHGRRAAAAGLPRDAPRAHAGAGALLIFDEVITGFRVARGGAQELFGVDAGPDVPRQDHRRRLAARRLRRRPTIMEQARAARRRLPGRHAVRESARRRRRPRHARRARRERLRALERSARSPGRAAARRARRPHACVATRQPRRLDVDALLRRRRGSTSYRGRARGPTPRRSRGSSAACSSAACTCRRRSSRRCSSRLAHGEAEIDAFAVRRRASRSLGCRR